MKIALAQLNYTIGAFEENTAKIINTIQLAKSNQAELVVFSELSVCGYPPLDLLEHKHFIEACQKSVTEIAGACQGIAAIIGAPTINENSKGKNLYNSALFLKDGKVQHNLRKALLPTYDIFDEYRYFQPADHFESVVFKGRKLAITICEDLWYQQPLLTHFGKNKLYTTNPMAKLAQEGCDLIINIAASPFAYNHDTIKSEILTYNARKYNIPLVYVNQVGAHTELIFDGGSRVIDAKGKLLHKLGLFQEEIAYFDTSEPSASARPTAENPKTERIEKIHHALVLGIRDYFAKMNFKNAVLGLSGGIDSAVTTVLAQRALGSENIRVLLMPSQYSSDHSINDAVALAENLKIRYDVVPIKELYKRYLTDLEGLFENRPMDLAEENIQARIRGTLLMAVSNKFGNLLLNTSNKSEVAVGYGTLYGDMNGGISVLGDVYKTDVFRLARYINSTGEVIPENTITKPPSAELRPDQKDSDSLPEYELLDQILYHYIELREAPSDLIARGFDAASVTKAIRLVNMNEYKRFQTPPILRVSSKAFGLGRRMPLVAKY